MAYIKTYTLDKERQTDVSPEFNVISVDKQRTQFLDAISKTEQAIGTETKWFNDKLIPILAYASGAFGSGSNSLVVDNVTNIYVNSILNVSNQQFKVTAVSGSTLTVSYIGGESRADVDSGTKIFINFKAENEGAEFASSDYVESFPLYNYTQIFSRGIQISTSQLASVLEYPAPVLLQKEILKNMETLKRELATAVVKGIPDSGSVSIPRQMGGIEYYVKNYGYAPAASAWASGSNLDGFLNDMACERGARALDLWMNNSTMAYFSEVNKDRIFVMQDSTKIGNYAKTYVSKYGTEYNLRIDPNFSGKRIYLVDTPSLILKVLRGFVVTNMGDTGASKKYLLDGEMSLVTPNISTMGVYTIQ